MSGSENGDDQSGAGRREVAYRMFAAEYDDATLEHSESDEERAPNYVVTPTGARVNRLFVVGVLTEIEEVNEEVLRARIVDPTGAFVVYAGQYQPDEMAFLERADPPAFLAVTGKARTFQPEDSDRVYTSIRPETINEVDAETRDRWAVQAAEQTLARVATMAAALERPERGDELAAHLRERGVDAGLASGVALAIDHYGTTPEYLAAVRDLAIEATEVVAGERDEASQLSVRPGDGDGSVDAAELTDVVDAIPEDAMEAAAADAEALSASSPDSASPGQDSGTVADDGAVASADSTAEVETTEAATDEPATTEASSETADSPTESTEEPAEATVSATAESSAAESSSVESDADAETSSSDVGTKGDGDEADDGDRLGDFEPGGIGGESDEQETAEAETNGAAPDQANEAAVGGDEMYEFSEEEREQIEEEYGTEFSTGTEVPEPGEAGIETPDPTGEVESEAAAEADADEATAETDVTDTDEAVAEGEEIAEEAAEPVPEGDAAEEPEDAGAVSEDVAPPEEPAAEAEEPAEDTEAADEAEEGADDAAEPAEPSIPDDVSLTDVVVETMREMDDGDGVERGDLIDEVISDTGMTEPDVEDAIEEALMGGRCYEPTDDTLKPI